MQVPKITSIVDIFLVIIRLDRDCDNSASSVTKVLPVPDTSRRTLQGEFAEAGTACKYPHLLFTFSDGIIYMISPILVTHFSTTFSTSILPRDRYLIWPTFTLLVQNKRALRLFAHHGRSRRF